MVEFTASKATRTEIFRLTQQLHFFRGKFKINEAGRTGAGTKSLTFGDGATENQITFTSSKNPFIKELTTIFEHISSTMEFGRRLERLRTSNPSGLPAELKQMERQTRHESLAQLQVIAPVV
jgi:hypothetical protein